MTKVVNAVSGSVKDKVALSIALPVAAPPVRFSSVFSSAPTAVASPFTVANADWSQPSTDPVFIQNGQYLVGVSRDPLTAYLNYFIFGSGLSSYQYSALFSSDVGLSSTTRVALQIARPYVDLRPQCFVDDYPGVTGRAHPHGGTLYCRDFLDTKWVWLNASASRACTISCTVVSGTAGVGANFLVNRLDGLTPRNINAVAISATTFTTTVTTPGWHSFQIDESVSQTMNRYNVSLLFSSSADGLGFHCLPHLDNLIEDVDRMRILSASVMMTPHPSLLYEGGQVSAFQLPGGVDLLDTITTQDPFGYISTQALSMTLPLKKGMYGFHRPSNVEDFEFRDFIVNRGGVTTGFNAPLFFGNWVVMAASVPLVDGAYPSGSCHVTFNFNVEFRTENTWFLQMPPGTSPEEYTHGVALLRNVPQFYENPKHVSDILKFLRSGARKVLINSPAILELIGALFPQFRGASAAGALLKGVGELL
jgi:hypothetical protein